MNSRGIGPNQAESALDTFVRELTYLNNTVEFLDSEISRKDFPGILESASSIVVVREDYPLPGEDLSTTEQQDFVKFLEDRYSDRLVILGLRSSCEVAEYPSYVTYLCAYSSRTCSAKEAARIMLTESAKFQGFHR